MTYKEKAELASQIIRFYFAEFLSEKHRLTPHTYNKPNLPFKKFKYMTFFGLHLMVQDSSYYKNYKDFAEELDNMVNKYDHKNFEFDKFFNKKINERMTLVKSQLSKTENEEMVSILLNHIVTDIYLYISSSTFESFDINGKLIGEILLPFIPDLMNKQYEYGFIVLPQFRTCIHNSEHEVKRTINYIKQLREQITNNPDDEIIPILGDLEAQLTLIHKHFN